MKAKHGVMWPVMGLAVVLALVVVVAQRDVVQAQGGFEPTLTASLSCAGWDDTPGTADDPCPGTGFEAGATADVITNFDIPAGNYNFLGVVTFTPPDFYVASDADIPDGAIVTYLEAGATLGLLNKECSTPLDVSFTMYDSVTDPSVTVTYVDSFADADGNTLPDGVDKYPDYLNEMFPGLTPRARSFGTTSVGGSPVSLQFLIFDPGTQVPDVPAYDPSLGYPSVTVLQNPVAAAAPNPITDFCTPLSTVITVYGTSVDNPDTPADEGGIKLRANPDSPGDYTFTNLARSQRDADGDGYENGLDSCPFDPNLSDPTKPGGPGTGDEDNDGIDDACDPEVAPGAANLTDYDGDVYMNRGDNCPLVANPGQEDGDRDGIGDACDDRGNGPDVPDGDFIDTTRTDSVSITGVAATPEKTPEATPEKTPEATPEKTPEATLEVTPTPEVTETPTATVTGTPTVTKTPKVTKTPTAVTTKTPTPTATPAVPAEEEEGGGFPAWAIIIIVIVAVVVIGGLAATLLLRGRRA